MSSTLRRAADRVRSPRPRGMGGLGRSSRIQRPRRLDGRERIFVGERSVVLGGSWLSAITEYAGQPFTPRLVIGDDVYIGHGVCITCVDRVTIGDGCVLSEQVYVADSSHGLDPHGGPIMAQPLSGVRPVEIGAGTFLGYRAMVLPGVSLGEHCVVGAGAVVTKSFPRGTRLVGVPARPIGAGDE